MIDTSTFLGWLLGVVAVLLAATLFVWDWTKPKTLQRRWRAQQAKADKEAWDYWSKGRKRHE